MFGVFLFIYIFASIRLMTKHEKQDEMEITLSQDVEGLNQKYSGFLGLGDN
jgi:hypothetical protein